MIKANWNANPETMGSLELLNYLDYLNWLDEAIGFNSALRSQIERTEVEIEKRTVKI